MKISSAEFIKSAPDLQSCPENSLGEMALIGRSNVGKSTLINFLTGVHGLAKTSSTPGHTRLMNFFGINRSWVLVDLPGYGYAKRSREEKGKFQTFVSDYLVNRPNLRGLFILIDARIPPQKLDLEFTEWVVGCSIPFALIFTKTDKLKPGAVQKNIDAFKEELAERCDGTPVVLTCSAKAGKGRMEILKFIQAAL